MMDSDPTGNQFVCDWASIQSLPSTFDGTSPQMISPYDYKTKEIFRSTAVSARMTSDAGYASAMAFRVRVVTAKRNGAGTDIVGRCAQDVPLVVVCIGATPWRGVKGYNPGLESQYASRVATPKECDYMVMDGDGLSLGCCSTLQPAYSVGMRSDYARRGGFMWATTVSPITSWEIMPRTASIGSPLREWKKQPGNAFLCQ